MEKSFASKVGDAVRAVGAEAGMLAFSATFTSALAGTLMGLIHGDKLAMAANMIYGYGSRGVILSSAGSALSLSWGARGFVAGAAVGIGALAVAGAVKAATYYHSHHSFSGLAGDIAVFKEPAPLSRVERLECLEAQASSAAARVDELDAERAQAAAAASDLGRKLALARAKSEPSTPPKPAAQKSAKGLA